MKYYRISESDLLELLANDLILSWLEADGVDNWSGYGISRQSILKETASAFISKEEMTEDLDERDIAKMIIKNNFDRLVELKGEDIYVK